MSRTKRWALATLLVGSVTGVAACASSDEDTGGGAGNVPEQPADARNSTTFTVQVWSADQTPLAGALIALDRISGRIEKTTDANGIARFVGIDPRNQNVTVTSYKPGYMLVSAFEVGALVTPVRDGTELALVTHLVNPPMKSLQGTVAGLHSPEDHLRVSVNVTPSTQYDGVGPSWKLEVAPWRQLELVATDFQDIASNEPNGTANHVFGWAARTLTSPSHWSGASAGGFNPPQLVELAFDRSLQSQRIEGSFPVLEQDGAPIYEAGSTANIEVFGKGFGPNLGLVNEIWRDADSNAWRFQLEFVKTMPASRVFHRIAQLGPHSQVTGQARTYAYFKGYPRAGAMNAQFAGVPELEMLSNESPALLKWEYHGSEMVNSVRLHRDGPDGPVIWEMRVHGGRDRLAVPPIPPSGAIIDRVLATPLTVDVRHCKIDPSFDDELCKAESISKAIPLYALAAEAQPLGGAAKATPEAIPAP